MKFMKLIFVDRTYEERSLLSPLEFYNAVNRISGQEFGVRVLHESPHTLRQDNPLGHHQEFDCYQALIFDLMYPSDHILDILREKLKHFGQESGWELAKYHVSNRLEDTIYANSLPDDWFRKQAWYNYERNETLRKKSLVKIPAAAFYFARISRDIHQIAAAFDVTEWAIRKWAKTREWEEALETFGYRGDRSFATQPTRDTKRDNGELFEKAHEVYTEAIDAGKPKHQLATIVAARVGVPRRRIHDWAMKYDWRHRKTMRELNFSHRNQDYINALSYEDYNVLKRTEIELADRLQDFLAAYNICPDEYQGERYIHPLDLSPGVFSRGINEAEFCVKFEKHKILHGVKSSRDGKMYQMHTGTLRWIKLNDIPRIISRYWDSLYQDKTPEQLQAVRQLLIKQREYMTMIDGIESKLD